MSFTTVGAPEIEFESKEYQMDTLMEGNIYGGTFLFYNSGDENLIIKNTLAASGNVVASHQQNIIVPGDSGIIRFTMSTKGRVGPFLSTISVITNTTPERTTLQIKGYIKRNED